MKATLIIEGKEIEIEISEEEYKKLHPSETGYERVAKDNGYFYVNIRGNVGTGIDNYCCADDKYYESANYYSSDVVAKNNARADKLMRQLRRFAVQNREPGINFNNATTEKYYIICDYENDELRATYTSYAKVFGAIYFDSREVANAAIINFNNVTAICKVNEKLIRIYFIDDFMDFRRDSEEEINNLWEWLEEVCINGRDI